MKFFICPLLLALCCALPVSAKSPKHLLVVTVTKGFRHDSIPVAEKTLGELAEKSGKFTVDYARTDDELTQKMSVDGLKNYDGVVFANTTGDLPLPDKDAFIQWVKNGHAFAAMHSGADTFHGFPAYLEMLGGEFKTHGAQVGVTCLVDDPKFPATNQMGAALVVPMEEVYQFKNFLPNDVHLLLHLDKHPNDNTPGLYPIAWCREFGKGRVFYTALGHRQDVWTAPWYQQHVLGGLLWTLKLAKGDARPRPMPEIAKVSFPALEH